MTQFTFPRALLSPYLGVSSVSPEYLSTVDSRMPPETRSFVPISHYGLVEEVVKNITSGALYVVQEVYGLSKNTQRMIGLLELVDDTQSKDYSLIVGIRNSNDKSFPASLALGNYVHATSSLAFSSEVLLARGNRETNMTAKSENIWTCTIGGMTEDLANGSDLPMRQAIQRAFRDVTGTNSAYCFSGWGGSLTEGQRAVVENRPQPDPALCDECGHLQSRHDHKYPSPLYTSCIDCFLAVGYGEKCCRKKFQPLQKERPPK